MSFELIDIGLYEGQKGIEFIKQTPLYTMTDKYIKYEEKLDLAKENGIKLYKYFNDKIYFPLRDNLIVIIDQSRNYVSFIIKVIHEHQQKLLEHIQKHYENVQVFITQNWLRLDFDNDGYVTKEDLQRGFKELYEFMKNYEYYQKMLDIKSKMYHDAITFMKKDLKTEVKEENRVDDNDLKIQKLL